MILFSICYETILLTKAPPSFCLSENLYFLLLKNEAAGSRKMSIFLIYCYLLLPLPPMVLTQNPEVKLLEAPLIWMLTFVFLLVSALSLSLTCPWGFQVGSSEWSYLHLLILHPCLDCEGFIGFGPFQPVSPCCPLFTLNKISNPLIYRWLKG